MGLLCMCILALTIIGHCYCFLLTVLIVEIKFKYKCMLNQRTLYRCIQDLPSLGIKLTKVDSA